MTLTGWKRCSGGNPWRCNECGCWSNEVWKYWATPTTAIKTVCVDCAEKVASK